MNWYLIAGVVAGVLLLDLGIRWYFVCIVLRLFEGSLSLRVEPIAPVDDCERIEFPTHNGLKLRGSLYRDPQYSPRGLIVFCPEFSGNHWSAASYCDGLIQEGFTVLSFDFRNQGESDSEPGYAPLHWMTEREIQDVEAALAFARSRPDLNTLPIGIVGISRGAGAAIAAAARDKRVRQIAVEGVYSTVSLHLHYAIRWASVYIPAGILRWVPTWHIKSTLAMSRWISGLRRGCRYPKLESLLPRLRNRPVLIIAGRKDSYIPVEIPVELAERIGGETCELWMVDHAKHNGARDVNSRAYDARLVEFFRPLRLDSAGSHSSDGPTVDDTDTETGLSVTGSSRQPTVG